MLYKDKNFKAKCFSLKHKVLLGLRNEFYFLWIPLNIYYEISSSPLYEIVGDQ
jgi:hypothetical protein